MDAARRRTRARLLACLALALAAGTAATWVLARRPRAPATIDRRHGLTEPVADFTLPDLTGRPVSLSQTLRGRQAAVLCFIGIDCPIGNLLLPRLLDLERTYRQRGVAFLAINSNAHESLDQIQEHAAEHQIAFPVLRDAGNRLADQLRIDRVAEILVVDADAKLRYRGAVDDQYARGALRDHPTRNHLADALDDILARRAVRVPVTPVITCPIDRVEPDRARRRLRRPDARSLARSRRNPSPEALGTIGSVTYASHAAAIIEAKCRPCHQPGEVGPFSLLSFEDARRWADSIYEVVEEGLMPPWHADPRIGRFANDRSLTDHERAVLLGWVEQGALPGDLSSVPPRRPQAQGWTIGPPDLIYEMPGWYDVLAEGVLKIQRFQIPTGLEQDVWVQAVQAMPGDRAVVHHICVYILDPATENQAHPAGDGDRELERHIRPELVCYAPGDMPGIYPPGTAKRIPAGAVLELQVHYQPVGVPRFDRSAVGIRLARQPVHRLAKSRGASNRDFVLRAGASDVTLQSSYTLLEDGDLLSMTPHMHFRGRSFRFDARFPDGRRQSLLSVPSYDFNWQNVYRLAEPIPLPRGTRIECTAVFDNSARNPVNPDPGKDVRWGDQSTDEMMIGYFDYSTDLAGPQEVAKRDEPR
jgi:peroxiredoxin